MSDAAKPYRSIPWLLAAFIANDLAWLASAPAALGTVLLLAIAALSLTLLYESARAGDYVLPTVCLGGLVIICAAPLIDWDARSIWFFHAKRMFFDGSLTARADDYFPMSHNDYPNLVPCLAATIARTAGLWNEMLPKLALFFVPLPALALIFAALRDFIFKALALTLMLAFLRDFLTNGSMDGILALYASALMLHAFAGDAADARGHRVTALLLAVISNLKNEGIVLALLFAFAYLAFMAWRRCPRRQVMRAAWLFALAFVPIALWRFFVWHSGLGTDLFQSPLPLAARALARMNGPDIRLIIRALTADTLLFTDHSIAFFSALCFATVFVRPQRNAEKITVLFWLAGYFAALCAIYLITPSVLALHLATSASRVMMPVTLALALYAVSFWQKRAAERCAGETVK